MRSTVAHIRDGAIAAVTIVLVSLLARSESWVPLALAVLVNVAWITTLRLGASKYVGRVETMAFVGNGVLLMWRFDETRIWVVLAAIWLLIVAADLSRFHRRYPYGSPPIYQQRVFRHHLMLLGFVGIASSAIVALSRLLTIRPTLLAILLLVAFIVVGITRSIIEASDPPASDKP